MQAFGIRIDAGIPVALGLIRRGHPPPCPRAILGVHNHAKLTQYIEWPSS